MITLRTVCLAFILSCSMLPAITAAASLEEIKAEFIAGYNALGIPPFTYDYQTYFSTIPPLKNVSDQEVFFKRTRGKLETIRTKDLSTGEKKELEAIGYEVNINLARLELEKKWIIEGRKIPSGGLSTLTNGKQWYSLFIQKFTSVNITPEKVFEMGRVEVARAQNEIARIYRNLGYSSPDSFYNHLHNSSFYITDKKAILGRFRKIDSTVRSHMAEFVTDLQVPPVLAMEWPGADVNTPPGIYLNHSYNPYGKDVFQFNFYEKSYNYRLMDWLYLHEAIPGHHLQASFRKADSLLDLFIYPGNFEGWACYVEYFGKELGVYTDPYLELGKWEWDLVRSTRLVLDVGIHYYGWSREDALGYWKENIQGQNEISEREVNRVTSWAAQALSYKVGASFIFRLQEKWQQEHPESPLKNFRKQYLENGMLPLQVMQNFF